MTGPLPHAARKPEQEMYVVLHCEPCGECVDDDRQSIEDGQLCWASSYVCPRYAVQWRDRGRGVPPPWIRERIVAREGAVHLPAGGLDGVPVAVLRRVYGLTIAEVTAARKSGHRATPVEARYLSDPTP
ncbi:hypothetical protein ACFY04_11690 [Streptomyces sp. NPDC001549]|uniref:hypothetical protein n=1 Tax=Streptomyces sp. NPDC001549 TaxID=3364586 RepID=UPI0036C248A0